MEKKEYHLIESGECIGIAGAQKWETFLKRLKDNHWEIKCFNDLYGKIEEKFTSNELLVWLTDSEMHGNHLKGTGDIVTNAKKVLKKLNEHYLYGVLQRFQGEDHPPPVIKKILDKNKRYKEVPDKKGKWGYSYKKISIEGFDVDTDYGKCFITQPRDNKVILYLTIHELGNSLEFNWQIELSDKLLKEISAK